MTVVYVDSVLVLNTLMDYVLLTATAYLAGVPPCRWRYALAALLGGVYAVAVFLPGWAWLASLPGKLAAACAMALAAYGRTEKLPRLTLLLGLVSCGFAGCVLGIGLASGGLPMVNGIFYTDVDVRVLLTAAGAAYLVLTVVFRAAARHGVQGTLAPVTLAWEDRRVCLTALCDTGNGLRDPVTGRPVLVAWGGGVADLWPPELRPLLTQSALSAPAETMTRLGRYRARFRLLPYSAVGVSGGLLLAVRTDWGEIHGRRCEKLTVALSPTELGEGFGALWGEMERSEKVEHFTGISAEAAQKAGPAGAGNRPLHRRQRHSAGTAVPGAGGGAGGPHHRSGGPADAD
jgi:stage II sporulation protein GA (sporulation sigma-E factor processing peptidase)